MGMRVEAAAVLNGALSEAQAQCCSTRVPAVGIAVNGGGMVAASSVESTRLPTWPPPPPSRQK